MTHTITPQPTPAPKKRTGRKILGWSVTVVASLIIGANLGGAPAEAETVTKTVEVTPDVCVTAINRGDEVISLAGEGFGASAEAMGAAAVFDLAGMEAATARMSEINDQVSTIDYRTAADECLAGAK